METRITLPRDAAREILYRVLSLAASDPKSRRFDRLFDPVLIGAVHEAATVLREEVRSMTEPLAPGELSHRSLNVDDLMTHLRKPRKELVAEFDGVAGLVSSKECLPYETDYCPQTFSVYRSQQLGDVAGWYRAFGVEPSRDFPERHDHVALELEFMAWLVAKELHARSLPGDAGEEKAQICREAGHRFFQEHLAWWVPAYAFALRRKVDGISDPADEGSPSRNYLGELGRVLAAFVGAERRILGIPPSRELVEPSPQEESENVECESCPVKT